MESKCANFFKYQQYTSIFPVYQSKTEKIKSKFYADVHNFWSEIQAIEQPNSAVIKNQVIWENRYTPFRTSLFDGKNGYNTGLGTWETFSVTKVISLVMKK